MTIKKDFTPDLDKLLIEFRSKENRSKRHAYHAKYDSIQQSKITRKWYDFMVQYGLELSFFDNMDQYYKKINTITKHKWKTSPNTSVSSNHPP